MNKRPLIPLLLLFLLLGCTAAPAVEETAVNPAFMQDGDRLHIDLPTTEPGAAEATPLLILQLKMVDKETDKTVPARVYLLAIHGGETNQEGWQAACQDVVWCEVKLQIADGLDWGIAVEAAGYDRWEIIAKTQTMSSRVIQLPVKLVPSLPKAWKGGDVNS